MYRIGFILLLVFLASCAKSGYNPHYIVSDTIGEEAPKKQPSSQQLD
ncbi:MAG: hypothetical protein HYZ47_00030 [Simkania negevensis]|nr:hypothetical protein [Simkania negevensis]